MDDAATKRRAPVDLEQHVRDTCECSVCFEPMLDDPVSCPQCGNTLHASCARRIVNEKCPLCAKTVIAYHPCLTIKKIANALAWPCTHTGCTYTGHPDELRTHQHVHLEQFKCDFNTNDQYASITQHMCEFVGTREQWEVHSRTVHSECFRSTCILYPAFYPIHIANGSLSSTRYLRNMLSVPMGSETHRRMKVVLQMWFSTDLLLHASYFEESGPIFALRITVNLEKKRENGCNVEFVRTATPRLFCSQDCSKIERPPLKDEYPGGCWMQISQSELKLLQLKEDDYLRIVVMAS